jgi:mRNA interferase MazF
MRRGEFYRATTPAGDPRPRRVFLVVSRQQLLDSRYSTVACVPVYSAHGGLDTEILVGPEEGLKHTSSLRCDEVTAVPRSVLRQYVGSLPEHRLPELNLALSRALGLTDR